MPIGFAQIPDASAYVLANATLPAVTVDGFDAVAREGLLRADLVIADGVIDSIRPAGSVAGLPSLALDAGMAWPCFVDMHTHLDKGHIWPRRRNPDGTFDGALAAVRGDREANWSAADVEARMDFALRSAYAHGTRLIRTHIDSLAPQPDISWPVFSRMRERWRGRIELQGAALVPIDQYLVSAPTEALVAILLRHGGVLGAVTSMIPDLATALDRFFAIAAAHGLDVDFHVDETADPQARSLRLIAEAALRARFAGRIVVGHCCSLARQEEAEAAATMDLVAEAGIAVVSLPMCNMYLQDRQGGRTPRWRGVTLLHEMAARGIAVAVASDNTRDPFYAYGDLDALEVFREAVRILHLDHPLDLAARVVTRTPAAVLGRPEIGRLKAGDPADLVLFAARDWSELLARPQADRTVLRRGRPIDRALPDYRELDARMRQDKFV